MGSCTLLTRLFFLASMDLIERAVCNRGISMLRYDGDIHSIQHRNEIVHQFQHDPSIKVFVLSLQCGGVGLNLTAANHVIFFDRWWNPFAEQQAIDRVHRIGQERQVTVIYMHVRHTIEDNIIEIQQRKLQHASKLLAGIGIAVSPHTAAQHHTMVIAGNGGGATTTTTPAPGEKGTSRNFGLSDQDVHRIFKRLPTPSITKTIRFQEDSVTVQSASQSSTAVATNMIDANNPATTTSSSSISSLFRKTPASSSSSSTTTLSPLTTTARGTRQTCSDRCAAPVTDVTDRKKRSLRPSASIASYLVPIVCETVNGGGGDDDHVPQKARRDQQDAQQHDMTTTFIQDTNDNHANQREDIVPPCAHQRILTREEIRRSLQKKQQRTKRSK